MLEESPLVLDSLLSVGLDHSPLGSMVTCSTVGEVDRRMLSTYLIRQQKSSQIEAVKPTDQPAALQNSWLCYRLDKSRLALVLVTGEMM